MSKVPKVVIVGQDVAERLLRGRTARPFRYVVSIGAPESSPPRGLDRFPGHVLRLEFDDIERQRVAAGYEGATLEDVRNLVRFSREVARDPGTVLVHCAAGVSRSTASAAVLLAVVLGPGGEPDAAKAVRKAVDLGTEVGLRDADDRPHPNRRVVWLADVELDRGGRLLRAVQDEFRAEYGDRPWEPA